ncbi:MAG: RNA 2',3'-cyclic phosphodiesterase [Bryobacterales bacterium]|nr:RNA 2',3'-cyclic phosphodiesterase [Bryobacterales bacterium]
MRLFTGLDLPASAAAGLADLIARLKPHALIRWSRAGNLHITTKFIGEWPEERLEELKLALDGVHGSGPISFSPKGLGWFPNPHSPRIFWVAIQPAAPLAALATATEEALAPLGVQRERRPYTPHLTLARIEPGSDIAPLRRAVAQLPPVDTGELETTHFHLYESRPTASGTVYSKLHSVKL